MIFLSVLLSTLALADTPSKGVFCKDDSTPNKRFGSDFTLDVRPNGYQITTSSKRPPVTGIKCVDTKNPLLFHCTGRAKSERNNAVSTIVLRGEIERIERVRALPDGRVVKNQKHSLVFYESHAENPDDELAGAFFSFSYSFPLKNCQAL